LTNHGYCRRLESQITKNAAKLSRGVGSAVSTKLESEIQNYRAQIRALEMDIADIEKRLAGTIETASKIDQTALSGNQRRPGESQRDFLIRTGKITPFSKMAARPLARLGSTLMDVLIDAEQGNDEEDEEEELPAEFKAAPEQKSHQNLAVPGFAEDISSPQTSSDALESSGRPAKRRRLHTASNSTRKARKAQLDPEDSNMSEASDDDDFQPDMNDGQLAALGESSDMEGISAEEYSSGMDSGERKRKKGATDDLQGLDDGNENSYQARLKDWVSRRTAARAKVNSRKDQTERELDEANGDDVEEWYRPCPTFPDTEMENAGRYLPNTLRLPENWSQVAMGAPRAEDWRHSC
jgi:DNA excision repair protein ERCC-6